LDYKKGITYSFLAYHNNENKDLIDVFKPLVKKSFTKFKSNNGSYYGNLYEVKSYIKDEFALDIPLDLLSKIVEKIIKNNSNIKFYNDKEIEIDGTIIFEFQEILDRKKTEIEYIVEDYNDFLKEENENSDLDIIGFIEKNKVDFCKLMNGDEGSKKDSVIVAKYINSIKNDPKRFKILQEIYLGSIISCYINTDISNKNLKQKTELVLDTNFIIRLLNLHSSESNITCNQLYKISKKLGFKFTVLDKTVSETRNLLLRKANERCLSRKEMLICLYILKNMALKLM
jgi:hypothetical protein